MPYIYMILSTALSSGNSTFLNTFWFEFVVMRLKLMAQCNGVRKIDNLKALLGHRDAIFFAGNMMT